MVDLLSKKIMSDKNMTGMKSDLQVLLKISALIAGHLCSKELNFKSKISDLFHNDDFFLSDPWKQGTANAFQNDRLPLT
jgi:hypothetical protein